MLRAALVLRERQEFVTRKMSAEELGGGVSRSQCADDDMRTREMAAIERNELLRIEASERPLPSTPRYRRPTARTRRMRAAMIALRPRVPRTIRGRATAALAGMAVIAVVLLALVLR